MSQELDNVIQSYDTNEAAYTHDTAQGNDSYDHRGGKSNGTSDLGKEDQYKAKRKRKRDLQNGKNSGGYEDDESDGEYDGQLWATGKILMSSDDSESY